MSLYHFRKALPTDKTIIWNILQQAIQRRKEDGSNQWQDGYPNLDVIKNDIDKEEGFVLTDGENSIGYCAILINNEPEYEKIIGKWLSNDDFVVVHRIAIAEDYLGQGLSKILLEKVADFAKKNKIFSVKVDTNFDNIAMLKSFEKMGYTYCGEVFFRGNARKAYEKILH